VSARTSTRPPPPDEARNGCGTRAVGHRIAELKALIASWGLPLATLDRVTLRIEEVAATTGLSVSLVRTLIRDGELPAVKVRSVPLVRTSDLLTFLESRVIAPAAVAQGLANELAAGLTERAV